MNSLLAYMAYRAAAAVVGRLPEPATRWGGELGGLAFYALAPGRRRMAQRHMRRVMGPAVDAAAAARVVFRRYGRYWAEVFWFTPRRTEEIAARTTVEGLEHFHKAVAAGRGVIFVLPHMGNWEAAGPVAAQYGVPRLTAVAEALANRRISEWFVALRASLGIEIVLTGNRAGTTRRLIETLRDRGAVALVTDRDVTGRGVPVRFFDEVTTLPAGAAALADRTGAPILPVGTLFRRGRGYRVVVLPIVELPEVDDRDERITGGTQRVAQALEQLIRIDPTQWHLVQPNWPSDRD